MSGGKCPVTGASAGYHHHHRRCNACAGPITLLHRHRLLLLYDAAGAPLPRRLVTAITARSQRAFYCLPQVAAADTGIFAAQHTGWVRKSKLLIQANMSIQLRR